MEPPHLLPPQEHPRDSLTHCGVPSASGWVALWPEAAANSPLLLLTQLSLPFCFHVQQQTPKMVQSPVFLSL